MTDEQRVDVLKEVEKPWHKSKKFFAFLLMEIFLGLLLFILIFFTKKAEDSVLSWQESALAITLVFTMGFIALAFNSKQAALDQYIRGIALTGTLPPAGKPSIETSKEDL